MRRATLIDGNIKKQLFQMTWPMIFGMLGLVIFNLVDTYFIGRLGVIQLGAMGFTFPVVMLINSFALGLGIGTSALVSRAIGQGNHEQAARITTDSLVLAVILAAVISIIGLLTIEPVFQLLGAKEDVLPYIKEYMSIWYLGSVFVVIPMVGNNAIRATGDTRTPAVVMMLSGLSNAVLDYLLIFGIGIFPEMGMAGAALATVCGRIITFVVASYVLGKREKLLVFRGISAKVLKKNWGELLEVGLPVALTRTMQPVSIGVLTALLATYGTVTVAGFGVASKMEMFLLMVGNAFVSVLAPFVGQNFGAGRMDRIKKTREYAVKFAIMNGLILLMLAFVFGERIAAVFSDEVKVINQAVLYLRTVSAGYIFYVVLQATANIFNVTGQPRISALMMLTQMFVICIPLALVLRVFFYSQGIYMALAISWVIMALVGTKALDAHMKKIIGKKIEAGNECS
ncbi:MATE family efflux transporter [Clostridia bacterium]|nr:MATE family efflux transporter [Clostridia bacterium]